jgi:hypothetical protein
MRPLKLFAGLATAILFVCLSACSLAPTPEPVSHKITIAEHAISPDRIDIKVGQQVTFIFENKSQVDHELRFGQQVVINGNHPAGYEVDFFVNAGEEPKLSPGRENLAGAQPVDRTDSGAYVINLTPAKPTAALTFFVTDEMVGEWEIGCFAQEGTHYIEDTAAKLVVTP